MSLLKIRKLTMRFGGLTAVKEFDLVVEPGQVCSIIGPNGAGKTTVFNAVTGIYNPTEGEIQFADLPTRRPFGWKLLVGCLAVGIVTAGMGFLFSLNLNRLWKAAVVREYERTADAFTYGGLWRAAMGYVRGDFHIEQEKARLGRARRWIVSSTDGETTLLKARTLEEAEQARADLLAGNLQVIPPQRGQKDWLVKDATGQRVLKQAETEEEARDLVLTLQEIQEKTQSRRETAIIVSILGFFVGVLGTFVVWYRARRSADFIALGGIARTFQNIRLFQNMTVLENVLIGMDRSFRSSMIWIALRMPWVAREERAQQEKAMELLRFMGLENRAGQLAKNLPYGEQRRLEIARAMACNPKLLLLDEPAAGMNPTETVELMDLIRQIRNRGITVLLIEHHMNLVMGISDRIAVLDYGVKIAEGTPEQVKNDPKVIEAYLGKEEVL